MCRARYELTFLRSSCSYLAQILAAGGTQSIDVGSTIAVLVPEESDLAQYTTVPAAAQLVTQVGEEKAEVSQGASVLRAVSKCVDQGFITDAGTTTVHNLVVAKNASPVRDEETPQGVGAQKRP
jgi:hypothetical protein